MITNDQLRGSHVALVTPMVPCGGLMVIDYQHTYRLIDQCLDAGVKGLLFAGTTGQSATLSHAEQIELCTRGIEYARAGAKSRGREVTCLASAGSNSTSEAIYMSRNIINAVKPDALLHVTGYYNNPPQEGLLKHFQAVGDLTAELDTSIILYNIPGRTGSRIEPAIMIELAKHPAIAAVKDATGDLDSLKEIHAATNPDEFAILSGEDHLASKTIQLGGIGLITASGNRWPAEFQRVTELANAGEFAAADELQAALQPCIDAVFSVKNPIPLHAMLDTGVRAPLVTIDDLLPENQATARKMIDAAVAISEFPHMSLQEVS